MLFRSREGNYADNPPTQPYTCGDSANPCERWPVNPGGSPITLFYLNSSSLQQLPGDPYGDINFTLAKYTDLTGPAPNLAPSVGTYQISNYAYNDPSDQVYARSLSAAGPDHYFFSGYTKFNVSYPSPGGYRGTECHEFLHVLGFNHISVNGGLGSQATCMGYSSTSGPGIDDQYLLDQTYNAPVGP